MKNCEDILEKVKKALKSMEYGQIIINMVKGEVTYIDVNERKRIG